MKNKLVLILALVVLLTPTLTACVNNQIDNNAPSDTVNDEDSQGNSQNDTGEQNIKIQESDIPNIRDYVEKYYLNDQPFVSKYPELSVDSVEIIPADEYENIVIDGSIHLSGLPMSIITGIDMTWLEYINQNPAVLAKIVYSYTLTEEQAAGGPLYPSGTYIEYAIVVKNDANEFQIVDYSAPQ